MPVPVSFSQERRFIGLNLYQDPQDIAEGYMTQCDNLFVYGGNLYTRWSFVGVFSTPLSDAIYAPTSYIKPNGLTNIVFTSGGKLYQTTKGTSTYSEILYNGTSSFTLNSPTTYMARIGDYLYVVDGVSDLFRLSIDSSGTATSITIPSLTAPTAGAQATLTNNAIDTPTAAQWLLGASTASSTDVISSSISSSTNGDFHINGGGGGGSSYQVGSPWTLTNGPYSLSTNSPDYGPVTGGAYSQQEYTDGSGVTHPFSLLLDNPADSVGQTFTPPALNSTAYPQPNGLTKVFEYQFTCQGQLQSAGSQAQLAVTLRAEDSSNNILASQVILLTPGTAGGSWTSLKAFFSFGTALTVDPDHYRLILSSGPNNKSSNGVWVAVSDVTPFNNGPFIAASGTNQVVWSATYPEVNGTYVVRDFGSGGKDFSAVGTLSMLASTNIATTNFQFRCGFVEVGQTTIYWTNNLNWDTSGTSIAVDITTIPASTLASVRYLYIQFTQDFPLDTSVSSSSGIFIFGPLSSAGQLSIGYADYYYEVTETYDTGANGTIESDPSPAAVSLTPTQILAEGDLSLTTGYPFNSAATGYNIYREGGTNTPGIYYQVAALSATSDLAMGATITNPLDPNVGLASTYSWNHTTKTFIDNTPDSLLNLIGTILVTGRGAPPVGAQCLCLWNNRLCLGVGQTLWLSWLLTDDQNAGLYFNAVNLDPSIDPNATIKGGQYPVSDSDNDNIQQLISEGTQLVILKQRSRRLFMGSDPTNFSLLDDLLHDGLGCMAPRAVELVSNQVWMLSPNAVISFMPIMGPMTLPQVMSRVIEPILNPNAFGGTLASTPISSTAYAGAAMIYHAQRLWLFAPTAGDTQNTVVYVYDTRQQGWTRFLRGFTGGCALSTQSDTDDLFLGGYDGQLYQCDYGRSSAGDRALPSSSPAAVTVTVGGRGFGQEGEGEAYFAKKRPIRFYGNFTANETCSATFGVSTVTPDSPNWTQSYGLIVGTNRPRLKISNDVRDEVEAISVSAATYTPLQITSFGIEMSQGRPGD